MYHAVAQNTIYLFTFISPDIVLSICFFFFLGIV